MIFSKIACPRSHWLRWHRVGIVVDYADSFGKLWMLNTDFKWSIRWKKVLGCVYKPIAIISKYETFVSKEKFRCPFKFSNIVWLWFRGETYLYQTVNIFTQILPLATTFLSLDFCSSKSSMFPHILYIIPYTFLLLTMIILEKKPEVMTWIVYSTVWYSRVKMFSF